MAQWVEVQHRVLLGDQVHSVQSELCAGDPGLCGEYREDLGRVCEQLSNPAEAQWSSI